MKYEILASFSLAIKSLSKERPRSGKSGHFYTPKRTQEYEKQIRYGAIRQLPEAGYEVPTAPLKLVIRITDGVPNSWGHKERAAAMSGGLYPKRGDLDNRVKAILDALNGVYYVDDIQIVHIDASMKYGTEYEVYVAVYEITGSNNEADNESGVGVGG